MPTAKITHISKKKTHGKVSIETKVGPVISELSGWMKLAKKTSKVNDTFEVPDSTVIKQETRGDYVALVFS